MRPELQVHFFEGISSADSRKLVNVMLGSGDPARVILKNLSILSLREPKRLYHFRVVYQPVFTRSRPHWSICGKDDLVRPKHLVGTPDGGGAPTNGSVVVEE